MNDDKIVLDHGSGGKISHAMVADMILPVFDNPILADLDDGANLDLGSLNGGKLAFSTDSYVVDPIFFPGGNIGDLAINGTVNDIAMCGAKPLYLSVGLIIEEGFSCTALKKILEEMGMAANRAGVKIVTGDTKVVPKAKCDKIFINTSGIGIIPENINVSGGMAAIGDKIILSGTMADHGITILSTREGLKFDSDIKSDSAALNTMVQSLFDSGCDIHVLRDPTRGGVGTTLNEIALQSKLGIRINEKSLPVKPAVAGICELLGFDPLYIANEGKLLAFVAEKDADKALGVMRKDEFGKDAVVIGEMVADDSGKVYMDTAIGGARIIDMLTGEQLPRIC